MAALLAGCPLLINMAGICDDTSTVGEVLALEILQTIGTAPPNEQPSHTVVGVTGSTFTAVTSLLAIVPAIDLIVPVATPHKPVITKYCPASSPQYITLFV